MLERVRQTWIEGVLERASWPEAVPRGQVEVRRSGRQPEPLKAGATVSKVFDETDGGLLILGPPGSGRTTTLLELARDLLDRAERDAEQPIPVVFNLVSWAQRRLPLADWLVDELHHSYDVPRRVARRWVDKNSVLPLLDGLDEVATPSRTDCVKKINEFQCARPKLKLVVCSELEEYESLSTRLGLKNAVVLHPLTRDQVRDYLDAMGTPLADVRAALDANPRLWELVQSPLMLSIVTLTYEGKGGRGKAAEALAASGPLERRRARLFAAYIERMFARRPLVARYDEDRARAWLARLARSMLHHSQSEFDLDRLQPDWLPTAIQRRLVTLLPAVLSGLVGGLLVWVISGLGLPLISGRASGLVLALVAVVGGRAYQPLGMLRWARLAMGAVMGLGVGVIVAWRFGSLLGGAVALALVVVAGGQAYVLLRGGGVEGARATIEPVERRYRSGSRSGAGLSIRVIGLVGGLVGLRVTTEVVDQLGGLALSVFVGAVVVSELISELAPRLADALADKRATPNEGVHRSARHGLAIGLVVWLVLWLAVALFFVLVFEPSVGLRRALGSGLAFGLGPALLFGLAFGLDFGGIACLRHLALRAFLVRNGDAPWRYIRFLDEAVDRRFLHKSGGSYIFVHRLLLEHFADRAATSDP